MLTVHYELVKVTNEHIQKTHIQHEKQIQWLERKIHSKDSMNFIIQQVLIKVIWFAQHFVDILISKLDEVLLIMEETLDTLKDQALTSDAYNKLTKQINLSFQKVLENFGHLNTDEMLALQARPSHARGGEMMMKWKSISEYKLWDESATKDEDDLMITGEEIREKEDDEETASKKVVLTLRLKKY